MPIRLLEASRLFDLLEASGLFDLLEASRLFDARTSKRQDIDQRVTIQ